MRGSEFCLFILAFYLAGRLMARAYPNGPPASTCDSMLPSHSVAAQNSPSPYVFSSNVNCFTPGQRLTLTLTDPILSTQFDGLFVQARQNVGPVQSYGIFDANNDSHLKTINCFGGNSNSLSHSDDEDKRVVTFGWTPPPSGLQDSVIVFKATVVRSYSVFWVGIQYEIPQCRTPDGNRSTLRTDQPALSTIQTFQFISTSKQPGQPNCTDGDAAFCVNIRKDINMCQYDYVEKFCCASCTSTQTYNQICTEKYFFCLRVMLSKYLCQRKRLLCQLLSSYTKPTEPIKPTEPTEPTEPTGSTRKIKFLDSEDKDNNSSDPFRSIRFKTFF